MHMEKVFKCILSVNIYILLFKTLQTLKIQKWSENE